MSRRRPGGQHRRDHEPWFDLVYEITHSTPVMLRVIFLIIAITNGTAAIPLTLGAIGPLALVSLTRLHRRERERRLKQSHAVE
jgi:hypothetical protein